MMAPWKSTQSFVSSYDFLPNIRKQFDSKQVVIHDVTLRDGEQEVGVIFRKDDKVRIARSLDEAGVDRIEAGLPSVSPDDAEAIKEIVNLGLDAKIYAFSRCMKEDVDRALSLGVEGLVMEVPSSDHLIKYGYGWGQRKTIDLAVEATRYAHAHGLEVTFFTIDATRAKFDVFWKLVGGVAKEGHMDSLAVADTFGVMNPEAMAHLIRRVARVTKKPVEVHAHNDFGLAVANSISAVLAGATVIHTTVNGIGERSGNTSLEEFVMASRLLYGLQTNVKPEKLRQLSLLVQDLSGVKLPPQKPVSGSGIFKVESGIMVGWWRRLNKLNMPLEMFPFLPGLVGQEPITVAIGKKSGKDSILFLAEENGLRLSETEVDTILTKVKQVSIAKKANLTNEEFLSIARSQIATRPVAN